MPLTAIGWTTEEDIKLAELVQPNSHIYNVEDPSRKNIIARESTWQQIAQAINKPVEECKKRWRGLRDGYMRIIKSGSMHVSKRTIIEKLQFLGQLVPLVDMKTDIPDMNQTEDSQEEQVITDGQEYYEITVVDSPRQDDDKQTIKLLPYEPNRVIIQPPSRVIKRNGGRKKNIPIKRSQNSEPIKILPKPVAGKPNIFRYVENTKAPEQRSQVLDNLIERVLRENTNEIDVFFRSMAASVKKLHPSLIPKVKMEVCNVIAKYEMQSFDKK